MNKKGFTTVELVLTIILVTTLMATITSVTLVYRDRADYEEAIASVKDYKNTLTKIIYDDIFGSKNPDNEKLGALNPVTSITYNSVYDYYTLVRKENPITLKIINVNENDKKEVGIEYGGIRYLVPGSDKGLIEFQNVEFSNQDNIYTMNITFLSKQFDDPITIHFVVSNV